MSLLLPHSGRRLFLGTCALSAAALAAPGVFAEELTRTPKQIEGPFYPTKLPLDTDNDLIVINNSLNAGVGTVTYVSGKILDAKGNPLRNAVVEIWQCDHNGVYLHPDSDNGNKRDKNFQGFGRFVTGTTGEYLFRTIKPVPYKPRTPHIHFKVYKNNKELLVTQCYIKGDPGNAKDGVYNSIKDARARESVTIDFTPLKGSKIGELTAKFDIVLGVTPEG